MCFYCLITLKLGTQIYPLVHKKSTAKLMFTGILNWMTEKGEIWKMGVIKYAEYVVQIEINCYNRPILMTYID